MILFFLLQMLNQTCLRFIRKINSLRLAVMSPSGVLCQRTKLSPECFWKTLISPIIRPARSAARYMPSLSSQTRRRLGAALTSGVIQRRVNMRNVRILDVSQSIKNYHDFLCALNNTFFSTFFHLSTIKGLLDFCT